MKNLSQEILEQIRSAMKRPEGTVTFTYTFDDNLFDSKISGGKIFEIVSGKHYFLLDRTNDLKIKFYYSSPGTGTRVATIDLKTIIPSKKIFFCFVWSPKEISLSMGPKGVENMKLTTASGVTSPTQFRIGKDGGIFIVGDENMKVMGMRIRKNGKMILESTALESWNETKKMIKILHTGESKEGYIFDTLIANLTFPLMVTGFEVYAKRRFSELEGEGVVPNLKKIIDKMRSDKKYNSTQEILETINFQDFKNECKKVYFYCYDIRFRELGIKNEDLEKLERVFEYRGRVTHNSSLITMLNESLVTQQAPIFNSKAQALEHLRMLDGFVQKLHKATLELERRD